jgi:hypothetical protein
MIRYFRRLGLKRLYEKDDRREVSPQQADKIARMLARLDEAASRSNLTFRGFAFIR